MGTYARLRSRPLGLYLIVAVYIALSLLYIRFVPIFEAPDEQAHAQYVAYYTTSNHLPDTRAELSIAGPESTQGPLYYAVSGLLLRLLGAPALPLDRPRNPQFTSPDVNLFVPVRTPADDAIRLARLVSTAGGIAAILATYALARCLGTATQTALHSSLFVALLPQFVFIAGTISNDSWATAGGAAVLAAIVWSDRQPVLRARHALALGAVIGLVSLVKVSLAILAPIGGLVLLLRARGSLPKLTTWGLAYGVGGILGGGWFYLRNLWLYGSLLNWDALQIIGEEHRLNPEARVEYFLRLFPQMTMRSFVGAFGQVNVFLPDAAYVAFTVAWLLAFVGLWLWLWRMKRLPSRHWLWLAAVCGLNLAMLIVWNATFIAHQGRLLFPSLAAIAVLLARGWAVYAGGVRQAMLLLVPGGLLLLNCIGLWVIAATYR